MPIKADRTNLPPAAAPGTFPPDADPWFLEELIGRWKVSVERTERHERPVEAPYFASDAGLPCLRQLHYALADVPRDPMPLPQLWKVNLGTMVHAALEMLPLPENWYPEVRFDLTPIGIPGRGRADLVIFAPNVRAADHIEITERGPTWKGTGEVRTVVDYMTQNGFGYKLAATSFKGGPGGPSLGKMTQVALAVELMGAHEGIVAHLAMEVLGPDFGAGRIGPDDLIRFASQWTVSRDDCAELVRHERARVSKIMAARKRKVLPVRALTLADTPPNAVVVDPSSPRWEERDAQGRVLQSGSASWPCNYCGWRDKCLADGDGGDGESVDF